MPSVPGVRWRSPRRSPSRPRRDRPAHLTAQDQISTSRDADAKVKLREAIPTGDQHELGRPTWRLEPEPDGKVRHRSRVHRRAARWSVPGRLLRVWRCLGQTRLAPEPRSGAKARSCLGAGARADGGSVRPRVRATQILTAPRSDCSTPRTRRPGRLAWHARVRRQWRCCQISPPRNRTRHQARCRNPLSRPRGSSLSATW